MRTMYIDIESYSDVDLKKSGMYKYVQSPSFQILLFAFAFDDGPVSCFDLTREPLPPRFIEMLADPDMLKVAHNAAFEHCCLNQFYNSPIEQWSCSMVHALYCGLPAKLSDVCSVLGLEADKRKMSIGAALIRTFCIPCKPSNANGFRTRTLPQHEPAKWKLFQEYNIRDVEAEREIGKLLSPFPVPASEWEQWKLDIATNARGVRVDLPFVEQAVRISCAVTEELMAEAKELSGLDNPKSVAQLTDWLNEEIDEDVQNLQKATVTGLIEKLDEGKAKRMLEIRQELGKTSVTKYNAIQNAVCADGRVRGLLQFYGANRTGRWAGRLVQVQNLPKNRTPILGLSRSFVQDGKTDHLKLICGSVPDTLSQLIRTAFIPRNGCKFAVADFSAIEARVIAWYAGETWRQEVFASHGKIYEASASAMFGVPIELIAKGNPEYELRAKGKIAELALGYQGSIGALLKMGATDMGLTEAELPDIVSRWRRANPRIVDFWYQIENAAFTAMRHGVAGAAKGLIFKLERANGLTFLTVQLPSGRKLYYANPRIVKGDYGREALHYDGVDQTKKTWGAIPTYGGKLVENIVQATARDCLAEGLLRLSKDVFLITVMHVHDEVVAEVTVDGADAALAFMCETLGEPLLWAPGLLLKADGFTCDYYMKE